MVYSVSSGLENHVKVSRISRPDRASRYVPSPGTGEIRRSASYPAVSDHAIPELWRLRQPRLKALVW